MSDEPVSSPYFFSDDDFGKSEQTLCTSPWKQLSSIQYTETSIGHLKVGEEAVAITGRIVSLSIQELSSKMENAAQVLLNCYVRDDTGCIQIKRWSRCQATEQYQLYRLGNLCTVYTCSVAFQQRFAASPSTVSSFISMSDTDTRSSIQIHAEDDTTCKLYRMPGCCIQTNIEHKPVEGHVSLKLFITDKESSLNRILVCVKRINEMKRVKTKFGTLSNKLEVVIFDQSAESPLM